jgi:hypothetical protein
VKRSITSATAPSTLTFRSRTRVTTALRKEASRTISACAAKIPPSLVPILSATLCSSVPSSFSALLSAASKRASSASTSPAVISRRGAVSRSTQARTKAVP